MAARILAPSGSARTMGLTPWTTHTPVLLKASTATFSKRGSGRGGAATWNQPGLNCRAPSILFTGAPSGMPNTALPSAGGAAWPASGAQRARTSSGASGLMRRTQP